MWLLLAALSSGCARHDGVAAASPPAQPPREAPPAASKATHVQVAMQHVRLHVADGIVLDVASLRGEMISRTNGPPVFDDGRSYVMQISSAVVSMDMSSLQTLLNRFAFGYEGAPLKNVRVRNDGGRLEMKGTLHKGIDVPFSTKASLSATPDGRMRLHVDSMKAVGIPAKGLLGLFGLELDDVVKLRQSRGIEVQENDIVIDPGEILPPPEMRGKLTRIELQGDRLSQIFGDASGKHLPRLSPPDPSARNYIYFGGGDIRFGKLTMHGADLQLIDSDPRDPFEFSPPEYNKQLVAGYSKNTPSHGLKTYMPDIDDVGRKPSARTTPAGRPSR
jgi:hypothetical protein